MKKISSLGLSVQKILSRPEIKYSLILSFLVALPFFFTRPWNDDVFILYKPEYLVGNNPFKLINRVIIEIPHYLAQGVFRPLSRLIFYVEGWATLRLSVFNGLPPYVVKGGVRLLMLTLLLISISSFIRQAIRNISKSEQGTKFFVDTFGLLFPIFFSSLLLLHTPGRHPLTRFPALYLVSSFTIFFSCYWVVQFTKTKSKTARSFQIAGFSLLGIAIACMIEITYLAPFAALCYAFALYLCRSPKKNLTFQNLKQDKSIQNAVAVCAGFLIIFFPIRALIHQQCKINSCYAQASIELDRDVLKVTPIRMVAPVLLYGENLGLLQSNRELKHTPGEEINILLAILLIFWTIGKYTYRDSESSNPTDSSNTFIPILITMLITILGAATIAGLSSKYQQSDYFLGPWRESAVTWPALCVVIACLLTICLNRVRSPKFSIIIFALLALAPVPTLITNYHQIKTINKSQTARVHYALANNLVYFDTTKVGNQERCRIVEELKIVVKNEGDRSIAEEITTFVDRAARNFHRKGYCVH